MRIEIISCIIRTTIIMNEIGTPVDHHFAKIVEVDRVENRTYRDLNHSHQPNIFQNHRHPITVIHVIILHIQEANHTYQRHLITTHQPHTVQLIILSRFLTQDRHMIRMVQAVAIIAAQIVISHRMKIQLL